MAARLEVEKMSTSERLQAMEQLWDALCRESPDVPSPDWHRDVPADRVARAKRGKVNLLILEQLRARLRAPHR